MLDPQLGWAALNVPHGQIAAPLVVAVALPADALEFARSGPHAALVTQPEPQHVPLHAPVNVVGEAAAGVQHGKVVEDENVPFLQAHLERVLLGQKINGVEGLGLQLAHWGYGRVVRREVGAREWATRELEAGAMRAEVVEQRACVILALPKSVVVLFDGQKGKGRERGRGRKDSICHEEG